MFNKISKLILLFAICIFTSIDLKAQDPAFSQFYANPLYLNPAFAGAAPKGAPRTNLNYRDQWPGIGRTFITTSVSYDKHVDKVGGGLGVLILNDRSGDGNIQLNSASLIYSYNLAVSKTFAIKAGFEASFRMLNLDWTEFTFGDMIDPRRGFIYQTGDVPRGNGRRGFFDASAGFVGFGKNFYFGGAVHHLNRPDESMILGESKLPMRFTGHMGADIKLGQKGKYSSTTSIMPNIIYQYQNGFQELNIGTYVKYGNFTVGAWYRNRDAFILCFGITTDKIKLGYSYDITVSKLGNGISGGSHEVSLGFNLKCRRKPRNFRKISCPSF